MCLLVEGVLEAHQFVVVVVVAVDGLVRAWERMQEFSGTAAFPTKASALCGWCPLAQVCPAAAAAGRAEPRSPEALVGPVLGVAGLPQPVIARRRSARGLRVRGPSGTAAL